MCYMMLYVHNYMYSPNTSTSLVSQHFVFTEARIYHKKTELPDVARFSAVDG